MNLVSIVPSRDNCSETCKLLQNCQNKSRLEQLKMALQLGVNNIFSKTIMESNVYLRFSIAIFPVNVSWQYKLFKRYRLGFLAKHFCTGRFLEDEVGPITRRNMIIYIIAKIPPFTKCESTIMLKWLVSGRYFVFKRPTHAPRMPHGAQLTTWVV
jgi:hypothetical protein